MKKPFVLIAAIAAVVCFGAAVAVARETIRVGTSVTLNSNAGDNNTYSGTVKARKGCQKERRVILTYGKQKLGSDRSNDRGKYKIYFAEHDTSGNYRTVASEKKITKNDGDKIVCKTGRSNQVSVYARR
jgi:hypothetical protein